MSDGWKDELKEIKGDLPKGGDVDGAGDEDENKKLLKKTQTEEGAEKESFQEKVEGRLIETLEKEEFKDVPAFDYGGVTFTEDEKQNVSALISQNSAVRERLEKVAEKICSSGLKEKGFPDNWLLGLGMRASIVGLKELIVSVKEGLAEMDLEDEFGPIGTEYFIDGPYRRFPYGGEEVKGLAIKLMSWEKDADGVMVADFDIRGGDGYDSIELTEKEVRALIKEKKLRSEYLGNLGDKKEKGGETIPNGEKAIEKEKKEKELKEEFGPIGSEYHVIIADKWIEGTLKGFEEDQYDTGKYNAVFSCFYGEEEESVKRKVDEMRGEKKVAKRKVPEEREDGTSSGGENQEKKVDESHVEDISPERFVEFFVNQDVVSEYDKKNDGEEVGRNTKKRHAKEVKELKDGMTAALEGVDLYDHESVNEAVRDFLEKHEKRKLANIILEQGRDFDPHGMSVQELMEDTKGGPGEVPSGVEVEGGEKEQKWPSMEDFLDRYFSSPERDVYVNNNDGTELRFISYNKQNGQVIVELSNNLKDEGVKEDESTGEDVRELSFEAHKEQKVWSWKKFQDEMKNYERQEGHDEEPEEPVEVLEGEEKVEEIEFSKEEIEVFAKLGKAIAAALGFVDNFECEKFGLSEQEAEKWREEKKTEFWKEVLPREIGKLRQRGFFKKKELARKAFLEIFDQFQN